MHLPDFVDVVIQARDFGFFFSQDFLRFLHSPGEVVAVIF